MTILPLQRKKSNGKGLIAKKAAVPATMASRSLINVPGQPMSNPTNHPYCPQTEQQPLVSEALQDSHDTNIGPTAKPTTATTSTTQRYHERETVTTPAARRAHKTESEQTITSLSPK